MPPAPLRKNDVLASSVLFSGLAISIIIKLVRVLVLHLDQTIRTPIVLLATVGGYLLYAAIYMAIRRGRPWGKIAWVIGLSLTAGLSFYYYETTLCTLRTDPLFAVSYGVSWVVQIWAFVLLFGRRQAS